MAVLCALKFFLYIIGWKLNIFCDLFLVNGIWHGEKYIRMKNCFSFRFIVRFLFSIWAIEIVVGWNKTHHGEMPKIQPDQSLVLLFFAKSVKRICIFCWFFMFNLAHLRCLHLICHWEAQHSMLPHSSLKRVLFFLSHIIISCVEKGLVDNELSIHISNQT